MIIAVLPEGNEAEDENEEAGKESKNSANLRLPSTFEISK